MNTEDKKELDNIMEESKEEAKAIYDWIFDDPVGQKAKALYLQKWSTVAFIWYRIGGSWLIKLVPKAFVGQISEMIFCMGYRECEHRHQDEHFKKLMERE